MTRLKGDTYGSSVYHRKKWDPRPFDGILTELVDVMNTALAHWATDWSLDRLKGVALLTLAVVACPCPLPIQLAVLGGTTIGAIVAANVLPVILLLGAVFVGALTFSQSW